MSAPFPTLSVIDRFDDWEGPGLHSGRWDSWGAPPFECVRRGAVPSQYALSCGMCVRPSLGDDVAVFVMLARFPRHGRLALRLRQAPPPHPDAGYDVAVTPDEHAPTYTVSIGLADGTPLASLDGQQDFDSFGCQKHGSRLAIYLGDRVGWRPEPALAVTDATVVGPWFVGMYSTQDDWVEVAAFGADPLLPNARHGMPLAEVRVGLRDAETGRRHVLPKQP